MRGWYINFMIQIQPMTIMPCNTVQVQISVTNIGKVTGSEVVQFYFEYMVYSSNNIINNMTLYDT